MAQVAESGEQARELGFLAPTDGVSLNRDHVAFHAKQRVLGLARGGFKPPRPTKFRLPGLDGVATVDMLLYSMVENGQISDYDRHVGKTLANVICGGHTRPNVLMTEDQIIELEREAFLSLCGEKLTHDRMRHMLMTNKPLRN